MYYQIIQSRPNLDPDIAGWLYDIWFLEMTNASALLVGFIPTTILIGIYLRVVPPSLDDYAQEVVEDKEES